MQRHEKRQAVRDEWRRGGSRTGGTTVYFVQAETLGLIKIGLTGNVVRRLLALQTGSPDKLKLLGIIESERAWDLEGQIHTKFAKQRAHGEWFSPSDDLLAFIQINTTGSAISYWQDMIETGDLVMSDLDTYSSDTDDDLMIKLAIMGAVRAFRNGRRDLIGFGRSPMKAVVDSFDPTDVNRGLQKFSDYGDELHVIASRLKSPMVARNTRGVPSARYQRKIAEAVAKRR